MSTSNQASDWESTTTGTASTSAVTRTTGVRRGGASGVAAIRTRDAAGTPAMATPSPRSSIPAV
ncbi:hypothetical protein [Amycolatopsis nalaikhensis]|uniref:Uncharacterized protein n=1 Tax=Amycolatopsis nalaikhensis TaxID=715472 RepID=A0ABY8XS77_9PSEU|nr:hypothetical protein [Amycolatopsis sp. 2-2]WIV58493.1 hypothetical protein QP939_07620 [Amycolatopsis sp. 2-2]